MEMVARKYNIRPVKGSDIPSVKVTSSTVAYDFLKKLYNDSMLVYESSYILLMNRSNIVTGYVELSKGGLNGTVIDVRIIARYAVKYLVNGIILCHNHPSGTLTPSNADIQITNRVKEGLKLLEVTLFDHIIISEYGYYSFADEGYL